MKKWFKAKHYGWGWYPATWQGWLVTAGFVVGLVWNSTRLDNTSPAIPTTVIQNFGLVALLILICYLTGEKPGWRWGGKDESGSN